MAEPNFTTGPLMPKPETVDITKEPVNENPSISGVVSHDVHERGSVSLDENFGDIISELTESRQELIGRFEMAQQRIEAIFASHPDTRLARFEGEKESAEDLVQEYGRSFERVRNEELVADRTERASEAVRETAEITLEMEAIVEALDEYLYSQEHKGDAEAQPTAQVIPFPSQNQSADDVSVPEVNMGDTNDSSRSSIDSKGTGESGENEQGNKGGRKGVRGSGNGGDGGDDSSVGEPSIFARDYSEEDILKIWDHLPENPEGVAEKIAIIREQIERTKSLTQEIRELGSEERLTNQLFEEIQVPAHVVKIRDQQNERDALVERKGSIQRLTWPDKLAGVEAMLGEIGERLQGGELTDRDVVALRIKHLDFHRLLSALEKIVDETRVEREQESSVVAAEQETRKERKSRDHESEQEEYKLFGEKLRSLNEKLNEWIRLRQNLLAQLGDKAYDRLFVRKLPQDLRVLVKKEVMQEVMDRMEDYKIAFQEGHTPGKREWNWVGKHLDGLEAVIGQVEMLHQKIEKGELTRESTSDNNSSPEKVNDPSSPASPVVVAEPIIPSTPETPPATSMSSSKEEQSEARKELEKILQEKLQIFSERMDASLRAENPTLSFAKRRGRILAQLPEFAEKVIERFGKEAALSPDEQEAMIEEYTVSIKIPK